MTLPGYDWTAALAFLAALIATTLAGRFVVFRVPALARARELNHEAGRPKMARKRFREAVRRNNRAGLLANAVFYAAVLPFCVDLEPRPLWRHAFDALAVLALFDFLYYLTHRFLFHGRLLRRVHALHHQSRTPTSIDALYVHPLETVIGLSLFLGSIPLVALLSGGPLHALSMAFATLVFTQLNTLNHAWVRLERFPFRPIDYITGVHAAHHVDMNRGNYATLSMFYDRLFGTYEPPVHRPTP